MSILFIIFQGGIGGAIGPLMPMLLIFVVFYFLLIMPQKKKQRALQEKIANLKAGDRIVTTGGIIGKISEVRESSLLIRSADKSMLEVARSAVADLDNEEEKKLF
jgi:preprotein translocase subunit YajC